METEGKWCVAGHDAVREKVRALGGEWIETQEERNLLFAQPAVPLFDWDCTLRLRILGDGRGFLTFKGPADKEATLKVRSEFETGVEAPDAMRAILDAMGFEVSLEYAKTREIWRLPTVEVALDTFYGDSYVEIEGPDVEVLQVAAQLGLDWRAMDPQTYPSKKAAMRDA